MKLAIIGSRNLKCNGLSQVVPPETTEIVSGGARGIDTCAKEFAIQNGLKLTEFYPEYEKYGREAPLIRNDLIIDYCDEVLAIWDGRSSGTRYVIDNCKRRNKRITVLVYKNKYMRV